MSEKVTYEVDLDESTTLSGLPAPAGWFVELREYDSEGVYFRRWRRYKGEAISVIETIAEKGDGKRWLHVSVAKPKPNKFPTWEDLQTLRNLFIGEDRECYLIFPTRDRYVNFFDVLHLFCCLDQPEGVLPHMEGKLSSKMVDNLDVPPHLQDRFKPGVTSI